MASTDCRSLDYKIGLMPIISPYVMEQKDIYEKNINILEKTIGILEKRILDDKMAVCIITEGGSDTIHIKTAFESLGIDQEFMDRLSFYDFSNKATLGDELDRLLKMLSRVHRESLIIGLFDRDKREPESITNEFQCLGEHVYKAFIPALDNNERTINDRICIEHYYTNSEIHTTIDCGHLYLGCDFDKFGKSNDGLLFYNNFSKNNNITDISIIDSSCKSLNKLSDDSIIISKMRFAEYVKDNPDLFDFYNFKKIYDLIIEIQDCDGIQK